MKKLIFFVLLLISIAGSSSAQGSIVLTDYRPLEEFGTDTLAYLQNNWGIHSNSKNRYHGKTIETFLNDFELPIVDIELRMDVDNTILGCVRFYYRSLKYIESINDYYDHYNVLVVLKFPRLGEDDHRPRYFDVSPTFKGLKPQTDVGYPWREEYRALMKDWLIEYVQFNYVWWK